MKETIQTLLDQSTLWMPKVAGAILIVLTFFILSKIFNRIIAKAAKKLDLDSHLALLFAQTSRVTLIILGLVTALGTLGVNVSALVAGLGLTGFALGFALKDTISNLLSGILILLYRPFKISDTIKISGFEGEVVCIDLRYTELKNEGSKILIPNSKLFTDPITVLHKKDIEDASLEEHSENIEQQ